MRSTAGRPEFFRAATPLRIHRRRANRGRHAHDLPRDALKVGEGDGSARQGELNPRVQFIEAFLRDPKRRRHHIPRYF